MGVVDYFRLPKRQWYWYRNFYAKTPPPVWPVEGTPAALRLTASAPTIERADGADDVQLVVGVVDAAGKPLSNSPPVRLTLESGPGELPTGRSIDFAPGSDIAIRDGLVAIAMRSWQSDTTRIRATSPGLKDAVLEVRTSQGPRFVAGQTLLAADRPYTPFVSLAPQRPGDVTLGLSNPTDASSSAPEHSSRLVNDGNPDTYWAPAPGDAEMGVIVDLERVLEVHRLILTFPQAAPYGFVAEVQDASGNWQKLLEQIEAQDDSRTRTLDTTSAQGRRMRVRLRVPAGAPAGLAELQIVGAVRTD